MHAARSSRQSRLKSRSSVATRSARGATPHRQLRLDNRELERTCDARRSQDSFLSQKAPLVNTRPPRQTPRSHLEFGSCAAAVGRHVEPIIRLEAVPVQVVPVVDLGASSAAQSAGSADAPEHDQEQQPSRPSMASPVLADLWYRKTPIGMRDDVQCTAVRPDEVACVADHHVRSGKPSTARALGRSTEGLPTPSLRIRLSARTEGIVSPPAAVGARLNVAPR